MMRAFDFSKIMAYGLETREITSKKASPLFVNPNLN